MFHDLAFGAESAVSGTVALLAAAHALSKVPSVDTLRVQHVLAVIIVVVSRVCLLRRMWQHCRIELRLLGFEGNRLAVWAPVVLRMS
jgi:hypothetical protein